MLYLNMYVNYNKIHKLFKMAFMLYFTRTNLQNVCNIKQIFNINISTTYVYIKKN